MGRLKKLFTKWYIKKGYTYGLSYTSNTRKDITDIYIVRYYNCPLWCKLLLFLFSPSVYSAEIGMCIIDAFDFTRD